MASALQSRIPFTHNVPNLHVCGKAIECPLPGRTTPSRNARFWAELRQSGRIGCKRPVSDGERALKASSGTAGADTQSCGVSASTTL